jgi:Arc/MetJ-type ribon-helix-helix transcriptional regulator
MKTLTVKLPPALEARLEALVRKRKQSKSELVREAIARLVDERGAPGGSVLDLIGDLVGMESGPTDLSTNPKHMRGYGETRTRRSTRAFGKK